MCGIWLEDVCEVWCETPRYARKQHRCFCCNGSILRGEQYIVHFSVYDGRPTSEKMCFECDKAQREFANAHDGIRHVPSAFLEVLFECYNEEIRSAWTDQDRRWRSLMAGMLLRERARKSSERLSRVPR